MDQDRIVVPVNLDRLLGLLGFHPYQNAPWIGVDALNLAEVLRSTGPNPGRLRGERDYPHEVHTARVAWLVRNWANDGTDPIDIECFNGEVIIHDGCHRIAAAIARGEECVFAEVGGYLDEALEHGFPVDAYLPQLQTA